MVVNHSLALVCECSSLVVYTWDWTGVCSVERARVLVISRKVSCAIFP